MRAIFNLGLFRFGRFRRSFHPTWESTICADLPFPKVN